MFQHSVDALHLLPIILTKTLGLRKVNNLPKFTQLLSGAAG